jgi:HAD superfamily hydrolase (TIGR01493 family)
MLDRRRVVATWTRRPLGHARATGEPSQGPESIEAVANFKAVMFDWRGTLVFTPSELEWAQSGLQRAGRDASEEEGRLVLSQIVEAPDLERLSAPGVDSDAQRHRKAYFGVFLDAGLDPALADALYEVESDATFNPFASDVATVLGTIKNRGIKVAVLSDIHFDLRPAFEQAGLAQFIDVFVLSFELGAQKPEPEIFQHALRALDATPDEVLMVGDRAGYDGAAVDLRITTLLLPPLTSVDDRRLHLVEALLA